MAKQQKQKLPTIHPDVYDTFMQKSQSINL